MATPTLGGGPLPLQTIDTLLSLERHIQNLERIQKGIVTSCLTWGVILELERGVRASFRKKKHAMAASGEWWLIGSVGSSTMAVYWSLGKLALRATLAKVHVAQGFHGGAKDLARVFEFLHPLECAS